MKKSENSDSRNGAMRRESDRPAVTAGWGWRYHHIGIPTDEKRPGERYLEKYGMHVSGFETSPYGVEWMRFEPDSPVPKIIQNVPHIAFEVDDLGHALEGKELIGKPGSPTEGVAPQ